MAGASVQCRSAQRRHRRHHPERERGSSNRCYESVAAAVVLGKWAVVALCSAAVVILTLIGFKTAMQFIRSENLSALMQFGFSEFALFIVMLLPFSAMIASLNMLAATYGRSHKEAQTYATYLARLVNFNQSFGCSYRYATPLATVRPQCTAARHMRALRVETVTQCMFSPAQCDRHHGLALFPGHSTSRSIILFAVACSISPTKNAYAPGSTQLIRQRSLMRCHNPAPMFEPSQPPFRSTR